MVTDSFGKGWGECDTPRPLHRHASDGIHSYTYVGGCFFWSCCLVWSSLQLIAFLPISFYRKKVSVEFFTHKFHSFHEASYACSGCTPHHHHHSHFAIRSWGNNCAFPNNGLPCLCLDPSLSNPPPSSLPIQ